MFREQLLGAQTTEGISGCKEVGRSKSHQDVRQNEQNKPWLGHVLDAVAEEEWILFSKCKMLLCKNIKLLALFFFFFGLSDISWAAPEAYGGSQARGPIGAVAAGLHQSHSNAGSEPHLRPTYTTAHGNARD